MKIKTKKLLRNTLWIIVILLTVLLIFGLWVSEPYQNNPFKNLPSAYSRSEINFNCAEQNSKTFQLKADSILNNAINLKDFIGISAGVSISDCGQWMSSAGYKNKKQGSRPDNNTLFRLASVSKPFTAIAIMQLIEKGELELDEIIQTYLPTYPRSVKGDITIRQLLNHTSGTVHYKSNISAVSFKHYDNLYHALDKFKNEELLFKPGTDYLYSSYGYTILGAIIEEVTKQSYQEYMKENIWEPTMMYNTSIEDQNLSYDNKASLYININRTFIKSPNTDLSVKYPGGGIQSTAEDMLKFGNAIIDHKLIDSASLAILMMIDESVNKEGTPYGMGWFNVSNEKYGRIIQHGGSQSGTSTFFRIYLDRKVTVVSLANSFESNDETYFLSQELANLALDSTAQDHPINYSIPRSKKYLKSFVGKYKNIDKDEFFDFTLKGNQLYAELYPYPKLPIYPSADNQFYYRHFDGKLIYSDKENVKKGRLQYYYKGELNIFERI